MTHAELVERVARAIYEKRNGHGCTPWSIRNKAHKEPYMLDASAAISECYRAMMEWPQSQKGQDAIWLAAQLQNANDQYRAHVSASILNGGRHE